MAGKPWECRCHRPLAIFWACGMVKLPAGQPGKLQGCELVRVVQDGVLIGGEDAPDCITVCAEVHRMTDLLHMCDMGA